MFWKAHTHHGCIDWIAGCMIWIKIWMTLKSKIKTYLKGLGPVLAEIHISKIVSRPVSSLLTFTKEMGYCIGVRKLKWQGGPTGVIKDW